MDGGYWSPAHRQGEGRWASSSVRPPSGDTTSKGIPSGRPKPSCVSTTFWDRPAAPSSIFRLSPGTVKDFWSTSPKRPGDLCVLPAVNIGPRPQIESDPLQLPLSPRAPVRVLLSKALPAPLVSCSCHWLVKSSRDQQYSQRPSQQSSTKICLRHMNFSINRENKFSRTKRRQEHAYSQQRLLSQSASRSPHTARLLMRYFLKAFPPP